MLTTKQIDDSHMIKIQYILKEYGCAKDYTQHVPDLYEIFGSLIDFEDFMKSASNNFDPSYKIPKFAFMRKCIQLKLIDYGYIKE